MSVKMHYRKRQLDEKSTAKAAGAFVVGLCACITLTWLDVMRPPPKKTTIKLRKERKTLTHGVRPLPYENKPRLLENGEGGAADGGGQRVYPAGTNGNDVMPETKRPER